MKKSWQILDEEKALELNLSILTPDRENLLLIDLSRIPSGMTILQYMEFIIDSGVVMYNKVEEDETDNCRKL